MRKVLSLSACTVKATLVALAIAILALFALTPSSRAQGTNDSVNDVGILPFGAYFKDFDSINMSSGSLSFAIPLAQYPQRGGKLKLNFNIEYMNSPSFKVKTTCVNGVCGASVSGSPGTTYINSDQFIGTGWGSSTGNFNLIYWPFVADSTGATHPLGQTSVNGTIYGFESVDGTGIKLSGYEAVYNPSTASYTTLYGVVTDRDGIQYQYIPSTNTDTSTDPNGNVITCTGTPYQCVDTVGRVIPGQPEGPLYGSSPAAGVPTTTTGCQGLFATVDAYLWTVPGPNGGTNQFKVCYAVVPLKTAFTGYSELDSSGTLWRIQNVIDYNGSSWTTSPAWIFEYNDRNPGDPSTVNYGSLTQITFPTGGTVSYAYQTISEGGGDRRAVIQRTVNANDGTGPQTWSYTYGLITKVSVVTDPLGNSTVYTLTNLVGDNAAIYPAQVATYQGSNTSGTLLKTVETTYNYVEKTDGYNFDGIPIYSAMGVMPATVTTIWPNGQEKEIATTPDAGFSFKDPGAVAYTVPYGNVVSKQEYDYGDPTVGSLLRTTNTSYLAFSNSTYLANNLLALPSSVAVENGSGTTFAYTTYGYDASGGLVASGITTQHGASPYGTTPGNQTSISREMLNGGAVATSNCPASASSGGYLVSNVVYYDTGTVSVSKDACTLATTYLYSTAYAGAYPTTVTNPLGQATRYTYDFNTGLVTSTTDPNNQTISYTYNNLWQLASVSYPDLGLDTITYQEASTPFTATLTKAISSSPSVVNLVKTTIFDGLGRVSQTQLTSDPTGTDYTVTSYDGDGRKASVTNPYRTTSDPTYGKTRYSYDALNRTILVTKPDNSTVTTSYTGNCTTVTDEAGKARQGCTDGLGRLTAVLESPGGLNYSTSYSYDALDDLTSMVQGGSRNRSFMYDSLKRLTHSGNPETGGSSNYVTYTYDADNNVLTKNDNRQITITYSWDKSNRMLGRTYSNGDPSVSYTYDSTACVVVPSCYNVGHRTGMTDAAGSESFSYDKMARLWGDQRTTAGITEKTSYVYNLDGSLQKLSYPSGHSVTYTPGGAGLPLAVADSTVATYASSAEYTAWGAQNSTLFGSAVAENVLYNTRLQPCWTYASTSALTAISCTASAATGTLMDVKYNFNLGEDNGDLVGITNDRNSNRSQTYVYDAVNRVTSAATLSTCTANCWNLAFTLDEWANLTAVAGTGNATLTPNANNQIGVAPFTYDASGNELTDATNTYTWNAESQIKTAGGLTYLYDGQGKRAEKSGRKLYWYGGSGRVLDETDATGSTTNTTFTEYVYFDGSRIAKRDYQSNVYYYFKDPENTSRVIAEIPDGSSSATLCYDADFYPYGGEDIFTNTCAQNYKLQDKERDSETNNDYFGARFYSSAYGRFLSPDWSSVPAPIPNADFANPQTLNLYAFVNDNPVSFFDLDGHECVMDREGNFSGDCSSPGDEKVTKAGQNQVFEFKYADSGAGVGAWFGNLFSAIGAVFSRSLGSSGGPRAGKPFTPNGRQLVIDRNAAANGGQTTCGNCVTPTVPGQRLQKGDTRPDNETTVDHIIPRSKGGDGDPETNGELLCLRCNIQKSDSLPVTREEMYMPMDYSEFPNSFEGGWQGCGPFGDGPCD
jgi:RHS repeat-associated protein